MPLEDPSGEEFGDYYGRTLAHLTQGGHVDQYNRSVGGGFRYNISHWEALNELEHHLNAQTYTQRYDVMWEKMTRAAPEGSAHMQWMAAGLRSGYSPSFWSYFLGERLRYRAPLCPWKKGGGDGRVGGRGRGILNLG